MAHHTETLINAFAFIGFRNAADGDYIAARTTFRRQLFPQFFWLAQQAVEKYLKCLLLLHRQNIPQIHDLQRLLALADQVFDQPLRRSEQTDRVIAEINVGPMIRYGELSWDIDRDIRPEVDRCVWEIRRYCQAVKHVQDGAVEDRTTEVLTSVQSSDDAPRSKFRLTGGLLESVLDNKSSEARKDLVWRNACFGSRQVREGIYPDRYFQIVNTPAFVWPELLAAVKPYGVYRNFDSHVTSTTE